MFAQYGIDPSELDVFESITPSVLVFMGGTNYQVHYPRTLNPTRQEAVSAVDFATRALLRLEDWKRNPRRLKEERA